MPELPKDANLDHQQADDTAAILRTASAEIEGLQDEVERLAKVRARAAAELNQQGASHRDIALLLGISHGRVGQLLKTNSPETLAVLRSWGDVREKLASIAEGVGIERRDAVRKPRVVVDALVGSGMLSKRDADALRRLQDRRLAVLQGGADPDSREARDLAALAGRLISQLNLVGEADLTEQAEEISPSVSCFVVGPIGDRSAPRGSLERARYEQALRVWEEVIRPACDQVGIEPIRADTISRAGEITDQVFRYLRDADVVIADVTGGNANVMYELGLRHTTGKLTVQIAEASRLPFDVQAVRTILFKRSELGYIDARDELANALTTGLAEGFDPVAATRVWQEGSRLAEIVNHEEAGSDDIDEPGFLEILAEAETAMPLVAQAIDRMTAITKEIGEYTVEATREIEDADKRGANINTRLVITRKLAHALSDPAGRMQAEADSYSVLIRRVDPGINYLLDELESSPESLAEAGELLDAIAQLAEVTQESLESAAGFVESLHEAGKSSGDLARTNRKLGAAIQQVIDDSAPIRNWGERIDKIRASG